MEFFQLFIYINLLTILPILFFGILYYLVNKSTINCIINNLGWNVYSIICVIGVPIHELCHLISNILFGHQITDVSLYNPKQGRITGVLGYVAFTYNPKSKFQQIGLFITGIAPMIGGSLIILLLLRILLPQTFSNLTLNITDLSFYTIINLLYSNIKVILDNPDNITRLFLFIIFSCAIAVNMDISSTDLKTSLQGLVTLEMLLMILSIVLSILGISILSFVLKTGITLILLLMIGLIFSFISWFISLVFSLFA